MLLLYIYSTECGQNSSPSRLSGEMLENNAGNLERHTFTAKLDCRYLLHVPEKVDEGTVVVLTLHGYSSNPQTMLQLTSGLVGTRHVIAALQAPNQHYLTQGLPGAD